MERTVFLTSEDFWEVRKSSYPELTNIIAANVPTQLDDEELLNLLELPDDMSVSHVSREKQTWAWSIFYWKDQNSN